MKRRAWLEASAAIAAMAVGASMVGATPARAAGAQRVLIEAYGDSTTLGITCRNGGCGPQPDNAVTFLQEALRGAYGDRVSVTNLGIGGTMATQLRDGPGGRGNQTWEDRLAASQAQIVTINYGINEVMHNQTPDAFYAAETALVKTARAQGKLPVLETSNPMPDGRRNARLAEMAEMTRRVAAEQHVPLVDQFAYILSLPAWQTMMSDGAHPKPELYRLKAQQDFRVIGPLVKRLLDGNA